MSRTKEELLERAKELDVQGRSTMNKEELEAAVADAESNDAPVGKDSEASDGEKPEVQEGLSPEGEEALEEFGEDSEYVEQSDLALDASGPLHFERPETREMTGAVSEEHAKEQEEALAGKPDDFVGAVTEAGFQDGSAVNLQRGVRHPVSEKDNLSESDDRQMTETRPEDVIDFPPPVGQRNFDDPDLPETIQVPPSGAGFGNQTTVAGVQNRYSGKRGYEQKAQLYTDGLSGPADHNLERAHEIPESLQTNNPVVRQAGDQSLSEAALDARTDQEKRRASRVIGRDDDPSQVSRNND